MAVQSFVLGFLLKDKLLIVTEPISALGSIYTIAYLYWKMNLLRAQGSGVSPTCTRSPASPIHSVPGAQSLNLSLSFLVCEMGVTVRILQGCCVDQM